MKRRALMFSSLCACGVLVGCGVTARLPRTREHTSTPAPGVSLSSRPCAIQTIGLLDISELPPGLAPAGPATSEVGPRALLDDATDGSVGSADQEFQAIPTAGALTQITQLAEAVTDYGTVASAARWMLGQKALNKPNDIPMYGSGVELTPSMPRMGDDALLYEIDKGAPYNSVPYAGPFVGDIYTDIQVREGDLIYALSIDSGPGADPATLAVSLVQKLMAKEQAVCG